MIHSGRRQIVFLGALCSLSVCLGCSGGGGDETANPWEPGSEQEAGADKDASVGDASSDSTWVPPIEGGSGEAEASTPIVCEEQCPDGTECVNGYCLPPQSGCQTQNDCRYDTYCNSSGQCVPYGSLPDNQLSNSHCKLTIPPEVFSPEIKCEFNVAPDGDAFPGHLHVRVTPMVVNFHPGSGSPSVVAPFGGPLPDNTGCSYEDCNYRYGVIRILKGTDCSLEANLGGTDMDPVPNGKREWARSSSPLALADLDGDGRAEIIAYMVEEYQGQEVVIAFTQKSGSWQPLWPSVKATNADGSVFDATVPVSGSSGADWAGPSVHDLDDDGKPEIIREGWVIDGQTGLVRAAPPAEYASYSVGIISVLANLDSDPAIEMTQGAHMWEFSGAQNAWVLETPYEAAQSSPGWAAIADFDPYEPSHLPEIVVASNSHLGVYKNDHSVFMNMYLEVPSGGGGPPTVADYDGDTLPEVGVAGADFYTVYDPDCQGTPRPGGQCQSRSRCDFATGGQCPDYILWSRRSQDHSSRITGSSVFDFEADGKAEVVYADECFARVYSGTDGKVLFSQYRSSSTWLENPVVADVDGDFRSELVVPSNGGSSFTASYCSGLLNENGVETHFAGLICEKNTDCLSGVCDQGLCRCTASSQCCTAASDDQCVEFGYKCSPPPEGTPGTGNTCRASYPHGLVGIRIYKDTHDRWVRSRAIWNQHAYAVTHINEDGTVPRTSQWANNWTTQGLNNFRQNVPGEADGQAIGDLTSQAGRYFSCDGSSAVFSVPVCNRGTAPVGAGINVGFYVGDQKVCSALTPSNIEPGQCVSVSCTWQTPPDSAGNATNVTVIPNDGYAKSECDTDNNPGLIMGVFCHGIQ